MDINDLDLNGNAGGSQQQQQGTQTNGTGNSNEEPTNLNGGDDDDKNDVTGKDNQNQEGSGNNNNDGEGNNNNDNSSTGELKEGDVVTFEDKDYTVDATGNLIDAEGNIFKEAKDVKDWMNSLDIDDSDGDGGLDMTSIQNAVGITVTDEEGKPVEFTNDAEGVKSYIDSVISLKSNEIQEATVNRLFAENPMLRQFIDYVQLTGTARGFGDLPDRSGIELDKDNDMQLAAVIKMAAEEFGNKSLNDNYIKYLRDSGGLYDEAKAQLEALVAKDKQQREDIERRAAQQRADEEASVRQYWENVNKVITSRTVAGYKLPETFTKEVNGKKVICTPNDFYEYLSKANEKDANGNPLTGYQRDLERESEEDSLNRQLLEAWLMYTGGSYKDLVAMAVKEEQVKQLKLRAKEHKGSKQVKVVRKQNKEGIEDIIL